MRASVAACALSLLAYSPVAARALRAVDVLTTTADGRLSLAESSVAATADATSAGDAVTIDEGTQYQEIDGFGYAITYSTCYNLLRMRAADRRAFLRRTFSARHGYGASYVRMSIGCSDFSSREYTLCDEPGLEHFALQSDETQYVIPVLREILRINPSLKVIAAPWTCPRWMKVSDLESLRPHDSWTAGHLNPAMRGVYAEYFVRFVKAMEAAGVPVYAVSPQNEPLNPGNCASLFMPWQEEAPLVREMASALKSAGLTTKIYVFDHNYNYDNIPGQDDYPARLFASLPAVYEGSELVVGAAYHNYGGDKDELADIAAKMPGRELIFTETSIGTWNHGRDLRRRLVDDMREVALGTVVRMCRAAIVWNLMLDSRRGPNLDGGCQTCFGAVDIDERDYHSLTLNSHYYAISHMAWAARPGARRIAAVGPAAQGVTLAAFRNADGGLALVALNEAGAPATLSVRSRGRSFTLALPARAVVSARW